MAVSLPPTPCNLVHYKENDILVANIRPYLKKIWKADCSGGASADVLVFRAKDNFPPDFLHAVLLNDAFYTHVMKAPTGAKMPRGEKKHILRYSFKELDIDTQQEIGKHISALDRKIALNRKENEILEKMAKQLYDYWFVQFDFPDENGRPYKSSGGAMEYNPILKREIPKGWEVKNLFNAVDLLYGFPFSTELFTEKKTNKPVIRIRDIQEGTLSAYTTESVDKKYLLNEGDLIIGMDGNFHMNYWYDNKTYLNQRCLRIRQLEKSKISTIQIFHSIRPFIKAKEKYAKGSTVGHLLDSDLKGINIIEPQVSYTLSIKTMFDNILHEITKNTRETHQLASLRDFLLPLLMNGQVTIKD